MSFTIRLMAASAVALGLVAAPVMAQDARAIRAAEQVRDQALKGNIALDYVTQITTRFGPRPAGSRAEQDASAWAADYMRAHGFQNVRIEQFPLIGWERGEESAEILGARPQKLVVAALGHSIPTPAEGVEAEVVFFDGLDALLAAPAGSLSGKIAVVDGGQMVRMQDGSGYGPLSRIRGVGPTEAAKRGAKIVSFNPLRERGLERFADPQDKLEMATYGSTQISSDYFQLKIGGDLAAVKGMIKHVLERDIEATGNGDASLLDQAFIAEHTTGFDAFMADVLAEPWDVIIEESGLDEAQIRRAGELYLSCERVIACWGMGITQHKHSVATINMIVNLLLLRGNLGREGAGACPVRGHSNVQGDRTMMIYEKPPAAFLDRIRDVFGFEPPRVDGYDTVGAIEAMLDGRARVFFGMGGNFAIATPDTEATARGLRRCDLTVHVTTKLNRSHLVHGRDALILPCLGRTEIDIQAGGPQGVTVEDSMSMVHLSSGINPPASDTLLSEPAIVARLAHATLGARSKIDWLGVIEDYDRIRDMIAATFDDFHDFNTRVRVPGGFRLSNTARDRRWVNPAGKAVFLPCAVPTDNPIHRARRTHGTQPVFTLATTRSHDQYNTTIYGLDDRYRGVFGERRVLFAHKDDIAALGMKPGDWVDLESLCDDGVRRQAPRFMLVEYNIPRGCLAAYYPETNPLVPLSSFADESRTPTSKSVPVIVTPHVADVGAHMPRQRDIHAVVR